MFAYMERRKSNHIIVKINDYAQYKLRPKNIHVTQTGGEIKMYKSSDVSKPKIRR